MKNIKLKPANQYTNNPEIDDLLNNLDIAIGTANGQDRLTILKATNNRINWWLNEIDLNIRAPD